jgi:hypothetical protein
MCGKFDRERYFVAQLATALAWPTDTEFRDPLPGYGCETGVDVVALRSNCRIGIQVTEYDGGERACGIGGVQMRAEEKKLIRAAGRTGIYAGWGSPFFNEAFPARVQAKVAKSKRYSFTEFDEVWLLIVGNVPGAGISTFVPHRHLDTGFLNELTADMLIGSKFECAFLHIVLGDALFRWDRTTDWRQLSVRREG